MDNNTIYKMSSSNRLNRLRQNNNSQKIINEKIPELNNSPKKYTFQDIAIMHEKRIQHLEKINKELEDQLISNSEEKQVLEEKIQTLKTELDTKMSEFSKENEQQTHKNMEAINEKIEGLKLDVMNASGDKEGMATQLNTIKESEKNIQRYFTLSKKTEKTTKDQLNELKSQQQNMLNTINSLKTTIEELQKAT